MYIRFLKLNPHCALFILLQALYNSHSKKILPHHHSRNSLTRNHFDDEDAILELEAKAALRLAYGDQDLLVPLRTIRVTAGRRGRAVAEARAEALSAPARTLAACQTAQLARTRQLKLFEPVGKEEGNNFNGE